MQNKTALITGASRGIGKAITSKFLDAGFNVVLFARTQSALEEIATRAPDRTLVVAGDITRADDRQLLIERAVQRFGHIDIFVPNAGIVHFAPFNKLSPEVLEEHLNVNLTSVVYLTQRVIEHMPAGSSIIFMGSSIANSGFPMLAAYAASKGAIKSLAQCLAVELAAQGIAVNAVAPGPTATDMWPNALPPDDLQKVSAQIGPRLLTGEFGKPEHVANLVLELARNPSIRGQHLVIDSGYGISV